MKCLEHDMWCNTKGQVQYNLLLFAEVIPTVNQFEMSSRHFKGRACKVWNTITVPHSSSAKRRLCLKAQSRRFHKQTDKRGSSLEKMSVNEGFNIH
jgi:hypothetical protein